MLRQSERLCLDEIPQSAILTARVVVSCVAGGERRVTSRLQVEFPRFRERSSHLGETVITLMALCFVWLL